jgi:hypothetical protein
MDTALPTTTTTTVVEIFFQTVSRSNKKEKLRQSVKQGNRKTKRNERNQISGEDKSRK